jgi:putative ABC transport system permease protein
VLDVAWQSVRRTPAPFAASAGSVAAAVVLSLIGVGIYLGLLDGMVRYLRTLPGEIVVAEAGGAASLFHTSSNLPPGTAAALAALPGVEGVDGLHGRTAWLEHDGRKALVFLVGLYTTDTVAGPVRVVEGRSRPHIHEILIDRVLAHDLRLRLGDPLRLGAATVRVAGIADGGNSVVGSYAFVHRGLLQMAGLVQPTYLFVRLVPGADVDTVARRIEEMPDLKAFRRADFLAQNQELTRQIVLPMIGIVSGVATGVGALVVGFVLYAATLVRRTQFGLLCAIGVPRRTVHRIAALEAGIAVGAGVALGLVGYVVLAAVLAAWEPRFIARVPPWLAVAVAAGAGIIGLAGAALPVRTVARTDPALVFRA